MERKASEKSDVASFKDQGVAKFLSFTASFSVAAANYALVFITRRFSLSEKHETLTKLNVSVALKLTIARFLNSSIILVLTNGDPKLWFKGGSLAYDATVLICIMVFQAPVLYVMNPKGIIK